MASLPVLGAFGYLSLRRLESSLTFNPERCAPNEQWEVPAGVEEVWFKGAGHLQLHGWYARTPHQPATATVLYFHGNSKDLRQCSGIAAHLATRGLDVLIFDYRGYGQSKGRLTDEHGLYADGDAAYDFLVNERGVPPSQLALYGHSLGTTVAVDVAARRQCAALVLESGFSSAQAMGAILLPRLPKLLRLLARNRFESARKLADVKCPVLVTHGTLDPKIPVEQGYELYAAAREPKEIMILPGADHHLPLYCGTSYLDSIAQFITKAVKLESIPNEACA